MGGKAICNLRIYALGYTCIVYDTSIFLFNNITDNSSEPSKELLRESVHSSINNGLEVRVIFNRGKIERSRALLKAPYSRYYKMPRGFNVHENEKSTLSRAWYIYSVSLLYSVCSSFSIAWTINSWILH